MNHVMPSTVVFIFRLVFESLLDVGKQCYLGVIAKFCYLSGGETHSFKRS